jgi:hypothetical protein
MRVFWSNGWKRSVGGLEPSPLVTLKHLWDYFPLSGGDFVGAK